MPRRRALREPFWALPASAFRAVTCPGSRDRRSCHSAAAAPASSSLCRPQRLLGAGPLPPPPPRPPDREDPRLGCDSAPGPSRPPASFGCVGGSRGSQGEAALGSFRLRPRLCEPAVSPRPCRALASSSAQAPPALLQPSSSPGFPGVFPSLSQRRLRNRRASPAGKGRIERGRARGAFPGSGPRLWPAWGSGCSGPR